MKEPPAVQIAEGEVGQPDIPNIPHLRGMLLPVYALAEKRQFKAKPAVAVRAVQIAPTDAIGEDDRVAGSAPFTNPATLQK